MSEANKALCRRYFEEVWNQRKLNLISELVTPDYVDHDPSTSDYGRGPDADRQVVQHYTTAFPDTHFTIEDLVAEGDRVVARWTVRGTHRGNLGGIAPTGRQVTVTGCSMIRIVNGKIAEAWSNWDALGMMQQLGVVQRQAVGGSGG